jgi:hypothetical protein
VLSIVAIVAIVQYLEHRGQVLSANQPLENEVRSFTCGGAGYIDSTALLAALLAGGGEPGGGLLIDCSTLLIDCTVPGGVLGGDTGSVDRVCDGVYGEYSTVYARVHTRSEYSTVQYSVLQSAVAPGSVGLIAVILNRITNDGEAIVAARREHVEYYTGAYRLVQDDGVRGHDVTGEELLMGGSGREGEGVGGSMRK